MLAAATLAGVALFAAPAAAVPSSPGYWLVAGDGGVFSFHAPFHGSAASNPTRCPRNTTDRSHPDGTCFAIAATPDGGGYWILNGDKGTIFRFGNAGSFGQPATSFAGVPREFVPTGVAIVSTPTGNGYWVLEVGGSGAGTVYHFGDAKFFGDSQTIATRTHKGFSGMPVGMAATPNGNGYWEVHSDGGVFGFGNAKFFGSKGGAPLAHPIVGIAATHDGMGYWLVSSAGDVYPFGNAARAGSLAGIALDKPIVGVAANPSGAGYWLVGSDGGVFAFGGAPFRGSTGGMHLDRPVFGITAHP
jgi:hypothetical protein